MSRPQCWSHQSHCGRRSTSRRQRPSQWDSALRQRGPFRQTEAAGRRLRWTVYGQPAHSWALGFRSFQPAAAALSPPAFHPSAPSPVDFFHARWKFESQPAWPSRPGSASGRVWWLPVPSPPCGSCKTCCLRGAHPCWVTTTCGSVKHYFLSGLSVAGHEHLQHLVSPGRLAFGSAPLPDIHAMVRMLGHLPIANNLSHPGAPSPPLELVWYLFATGPGCLTLDGQGSHATAAGWDLLT